MDVEFDGQVVRLTAAQGDRVRMWTGPFGVDPAGVRGMVERALEEPPGYPPLRQSVVPGDRVVLAVARSLPSAGPILEAVVGVLREAGVRLEDITALTAGGGAGPDWPSGLEVVAFDAADRSRLAYLASTKEGQRIYLDRLLTDADVVVPIGWLSLDAGMVCRGPWSVIYPDLSDQAPTAGAPAAAGGRSSTPGGRLQESQEVSWLLGSRFQVAVEPGLRGAAGVISGEAEGVLKRGLESARGAWHLAEHGTRDLVVAGIGLPWKRSTLDDLARALETCTRLVRPGGKIAVLSRLAAEPGPALRHLASLDEPTEHAHPLKGFESAEDYHVARAVLTALRAASVYLLSELPEDLVEDLGVIGLGRAGEADRLAARATSGLVLSAAELIEAG